MQVTGVGGESGVVSSEQGYVQKGVGYICEVGYVTM